DQRGHGDDKAGGGRDQRFRNTGGHGSQRSCSCRAEAVEGVDDAHDGAEEADEGGRLSDGGKPRHTRLHMGEGLAGGGLGGSLKPLGVGWCAASAGLPLVLVVDLVEDSDQRAWPELVGDGGDLRKAPGLAESAYELLALGFRSSECFPLREHDGPGKDAEEKQDPKHGKRGGPTVVQHFRERAGLGSRGGSRDVGGVGVLEEEYRKGQKSHAEFSLLRWRWWRMLRIWVGTLGWIFSFQSRTRHSEQSAAESKNLPYRLDAHNVRTVLPRLPGP